MKNQTPYAQPMLQTRRHLFKSAMVMPLAAYLPASFAQSAAYPARAAELIIPFPAGGATD